MDGYVTIGTKLDSSMIDKQIGLLEDKLDGLVEEYDILEKAEPFEGQQEQLIKLGTEIDTTRNKLAKLVDKKQEMSRTDLSGLSNSLKDVGNGVENVVKKVARWGLAVIGVRSAYSAIRGAISTLSQYDTGMSAKVEYIRWALANTLKPVIEYILKLMQRLVAYVIYIGKAWGLINKNADFSSKAFQKAKNSTGGIKNNLKGAGKAAKELQKTLTGFDEMNILQKNGTTAVGGGGGGIGGIGDLFPLDELTSLGDIKMPWWIEWIAQNGETVKKIIEGIAAAVLMLKYHLTLLQGIGLFMVIDGVVNGLKDIKNYIEDKSWDNFSKVLKDIAETLGGLGLLLKVSNPFGLILLVIGQILSMASGIIDWIKSFIGFIKDPSWDKYVETMKNATKALGYLGDAIIWIVDKALGGWEKVMGKLKPAADWIKNKVADPIKTIFKNTWDGVYSTAKKSWGTITKLFSNSGKIYSGLKDGIADVFKKIVNLLISGINVVIAKPFDKLNEALNKIKDVKIVGIKPFDKFWSKNPISVPKIPKLARGGIVNNPGPGIMMGSYVAGEKGAEAVLPLTDDTLQRLASMIPITVNLTNTMNGRVISKELQKINAENNFAGNR